MKKSILKVLSALSVLAAIAYNVNSGQSETSAGAVDISSIGKVANAACEYTNWGGGYTVTLWGECNRRCDAGGNSACPI